MGNVGHGDFLPLSEGAGGANSGEIFIKTMIDIYNYFNNKNTNKLI